jgi:hypothetical protein
LASTGEALAAIERLEREVDARLRAVERAAPSARAFVEGVRRDRARHLAEREELRRRLRLPPSAGGDRAADVREPADPSLEGLRVAQQALAHAVAEGLPAIGDARAVHRLGAQLVDLARHLAVVELWIETEQQRE